ncbi:Mitochondrial ribosome-associated GTPase 2 [Nowakowskiella sp. JEL0078]|nr:Mitochondrial ribosome-associated GTPase 2 [Nowakowskiella sp. JEL0078]
MLPLLPIFVKTERFLDYKRITVVAGSGGDGAISFQNEMRSRGRRHLAPPNGGDGGTGGDVFIVGSKDITTLSGLSIRYQAQNGGKGQASNKHGKNGENTYIYVPLGTIIKSYEMSKPVTVEETQNIENEKIEAAKNLDEEIDEFEDEIDVNLSEEQIAKLRTQKIEEILRKKKFLARLEFCKKYFRFRETFEQNPKRLRELLDRIPRKPAKPSPITLDITKHDEKHLITKGGASGSGNPHFLTQQHRMPQIAGRGIKTDPVFLELELKTIADSGLVGLPNAGKSSFLKAVSNAQPKIKNVPFTTLNPYVGTVEFKDFWTMTIADIPGIVRGAHSNVGLGHTFLRHIERSKLLTYVVDVSVEKPWEDWLILRDELESYLPGLSLKPSVIIANKSDLSSVSPQRLKDMTDFIHEEMKSFSRKSKSEYANVLPIIVPVSSKYGINIEMALNCIRAVVENAQ